MANHDVVPPVRMTWCYLVHLGAWGFYYQQLVGHALNPTRSDQPADRGPTEAPA